MKKVFRVIILLLSCLLVISCSNTGTEGNWHEFKYSIKRGERIINTKDKIIVERSFYSIEVNKIYLTVEWQAQNLGKEPDDYGWTSKYILDKDNRIYSPNEGRVVENIQPLENTGKMYVSYLLPDKIDINNIYWGLHHSDMEGLYYKIKLLPSKIN